MATIENGGILAAHLKAGFPALADRPWTVTYRQIINESSFKAMFPFSPVAAHFAHAVPGDDALTGDAWDPATRSTGVRDRSGAVPGVARHAPGC